MDSYDAIFETSSNIKETASYLLNNVCSYKAMIGLSNYFSKNKNADLAFDFALQVFQKDLMKDKEKRGGGSHVININEYREHMSHIGSLVTAFPLNKMNDCLIKVTKYFKFENGSF